MFVCHPILKREEKISLKTKHMIVECKLLHTTLVSEAPDSRLIITSCDCVYCNLFFSLKDNVGIEKILLLLFVVVPLLNNIVDSK